MLRALFSDLDNTLLYSTCTGRSDYIDIRDAGGKSIYVRREIINILEEMRLQNVVVVLVSGRSFRSYNAIRRFIPHDYGVIEHGGAIYHVHGGSNVDVAWQETHRSSLSDPPRKSGRLWECRAHLSSKGYQIDDSGRYYSFRITGLRDQIIEGEAKDALSNKMRSELLEYGAKCVSNEEGIDVIPLTSGKGNVASFLMKKLGLSSRECAAIGDGDSDIEMLSRVCYAACPYNATLAVKSCVRQRNGFVSNKKNAAGALDILSYVASRISGAGRALPAD